MLSMILYGRNDSYGYNLHKRAALSLNCMAEVLDAEGDEILFVDYNTPDDYPAFPEAIRDTLTPRARRLLRIFRVRPAQHRQFRDRTHLLALEPIARNVALRRSNPGNHWILSTNTDMIFVPRTRRSLSAVAAELDDALYHMPRFEIPETLWEGLDRTDPAGTIRAIERWGWELHLNEIVLGSDTILYDAPGDFQLAPRADLFRIDGFDERMLLGWHVDSNLARRLGFLRSPPRSLADRFFGYHCDHTRQVTPAHRHDRVENDPMLFIDGLTGPQIPGQSASWGLASETIEEIRLDHGVGRYVSALRAGIGEPMSAPTEIAYRQESYDKVGYDPRHVVPFLIDALSCYPRATTIGWIGVEPRLLGSFAAAWRALGFTGDLMIPAEAEWLIAASPAAARPVPFADLAREAAAFVIDFGPRPPDGAPGASPPDPARALRWVQLWFRRLVKSERRRLENKAAAPRRFIAVNAVHGRFNALVETHIAAAAAPIATRLRQGFVLPPERGVDDPALLVRKLEREIQALLRSRSWRVTAPLRALARRRFGAAAARISTGLRGAPRNLSEKGVRSLLPVLGVGGAGRRDGTGIGALAGTEGYVFYGGYLDLMDGAYRLRVAFAPGRIPAPLLEAELMILEIVSSNTVLAFGPVRGADLARGEVALDFIVSENLVLFAAPLRIEARLLTRGLVPARVTQVTLEELAEGTVGSPATALDWLPLMFVGPAGEPLPGRMRWGRSRWRRLRRPAVTARSPDTPLRATAAGVVARAGQGGYVVFGPYTSLLPGRYLLEVDLAPNPEARSPACVGAGEITLDVFCLADNSFLALAPVGARTLAGDPERLEFTVPDRPDSTGNPMRLEFRVWSSGAIRFMVRGVRTRPVALLPIGRMDDNGTAAVPLGLAAAS